MYQVNLKGDGLYQVLARGYGEELTLYDQTDEGETPMSLLLMALSSCVTMCIQGYYARQGQEQPVLAVSARYADEQFSLVITLPQELSPIQEQVLRRAIDQHCRVKRLLRDDIQVGLTFISSHQKGE